jgi:hypothetical protein
LTEDEDDDDGYGFHSQEEYEEWELEWHPEWSMSSPALAGFVSMLLRQFNAEYGADCKTLADLFEYLKAHPEVKPPLPSGWQ